MAITTDGAGNFKAALKHHGDDYETFQDLLAGSEGDNELWHINFDDLNDIWCRAEELIQSDAAEIPLSSPDESSSRTVNAGFVEESQSEHGDSGFRIIPLPENMTKEVIQDVNMIAMLPSRIDCSAHEFNSIGRTDSFAALRNDQTYANQYIAVFRKLNGIWKMNSTRLGRETFNRYLNGRKIQKPHRIRWNRIYDAVCTVYILSALIY